MLHIAFGLSAGLINMVGNIKFLNRPGFLKTQCHIGQSRIPTIGNQFVDCIVKTYLDIISFGYGIKIVCHQEECQVVYVDKWIFIP